MLDLITAGLLSVGETLVYRRPRAGEEYVATIDRRGRLQLPDGSVYKTLSGTAWALTGTNVDGWEVWSVASSGKVLGALRQELLTAAEEDLDPDSAETGQGALRMQRLAFLRAARDSAETAPKVITVRELLSHWGSAIRDSDLDDQVEADLANHGLGTDPHFAEVGLQELVTLRSAAQLSEATAVARVKDEASASPTVSVAPPRTVVRGLKVGALRSASNGVESVTPNATLEEAITKMMVNDYSQLAVMTGTRNLNGAVSWRSIARARNIDPGTPLKSAVFTAQEFPHTADLLQVLPTLDEDDFFLVRGPTNEIAGIVTAADVVRMYRDMASPFLMIGEIDQMLRRMIEVTFDNATITGICDPDGERKLTSVSQLSVGDYQRILDHQDRWTDLDWRLDRRVFCDQLDEIRKIRNAMMHFNGDTHSEQTSSMLRHFILLLREYATT